MKHDTKSQIAAYNFFAVVYVAIIAISFYFIGTMSKIATMVIIPVAFFTFWIYPDFDRIKKVISYPGWMLIGIVIFYSLSVFVWILNLEEAIYIKAGTTRVFYYVVNVLVVLSGTYLFGSKTIDFTLYGAFAANSMCVLSGLAKFGISQSINDFINTMKTGEQKGFMAYTEVQDITYIYVFFIIYYLLVSDYSVKKKALLIAGCVFFTLVGFKRILFMSIAIGIVLMLIFIGLPERYKNIYLLFLSGATACAAFFYVPFIRLGAFEYIMNYFNIDTKARVEVYNHFAYTYVISPTFIGRGIDFVLRHIKYVQTLKLNFVGSSVSYLHNDILVRYIEMGFWGFLGWLYGTCIFLCKWMYKNCGLLACGFYAIINVVNFINFSVGNTNHSFVVRLAFGVLVAGTACKMMLEDNKNNEIAE